MHEASAAPKMSVFGSQSISRRVAFLLPDAQERIGKQVECTCDDGVTRHINTIKINALMLW
jgi:hypothetical protein